LQKAEIDRLDNPELNRQLDFHQEEEKKLPKPVNVSDKSETTERVPMKSPMKKKPKRILHLKKAVQRYLQRSQNTGNSSLTAQPSPAANNVPMAGPEDSFYLA